MRLFGLLASLADLGTPPPKILGTPLPYISRELDVCVGHAVGCRMNGPCVSCELDVCVGHAVGRSMNGPCLPREHDVYVVYAVSHSVNDGPCVSCEVGGNGESGSGC